MSITCNAFNNNHILWAHKTLDEWISINIAAGSIIYPNKAIIRVKQINGTLSSLSQITGLVAKKATSLSQSTYLFCILVKELYVLRETVNQFVIGLSQIF